MEEQIKTPFPFDINSIISYLTTTTYQRHAYLKSEQPFNSHPASSTRLSAQIYSKQNSHSNRFTLYQISTITQHRLLGCCPNFTAAQAAGAECILHVGIHLTRDILPFIVYKSTPCHIFPIHKLNRWQCPRSATHYILPSLCILYYEDIL